MNIRNSITSFMLIVASVVVCAQNSAKKTLKEAYAGKFLIGTASDLRGLSPAEFANVKSQYDIVTPENCMKPQPIHPAEGRYSFNTTDAMVEWCKQNGLKVWGHTLLWHSQTSPWFFQAVNREVSEGEYGSRSRVNPNPNPNPNPGAPRPSKAEVWRNSIQGEMASREVALERLEKHIKTVVGRYKGSIIGWDVINESIADGGKGTTENLRDFSWYEVVGSDVIALAFKWAHEADPDAQLYYNDYNIEQGAVENKGKHSSSMLLLKSLIAEKVPITGVGIQGHWHLNTNLADVEKAIENYASLGLRVSITELDVTAIGDNSGALSVNQGEKGSNKDYEKQAEVYRKLFEIFLRHADVIDRVTFWGISDVRSWRTGQDALLFDGQLNPKPAFKAIVDASLK